MTERGERHVQRSAQQFVIGPSQLQWQDMASGSSAGRLVIDIDERGAPLPRAVQGRVTVDLGATSRFCAALDDEGRHRWGPIAPCARVTVDLQSPARRWQGHAYLDSNEGDEPISEPFTRWDWMRAALPDGRTAVVYDVGQRIGGERCIARAFAPDGQDEALAVPAVQRLKPSGWRIERRVRGESGSARLQHTLEDTPFYARSLLTTQLGGSELQAVHETLDTRRFAAPWVQALLPFRMPRRP